MIGQREAGSHGRELQPLPQLSQKQEDLGSSCWPHLQAGGHTGTGFHSLVHLVSWSLLRAPVSGKKLAAVWPVTITHFLKCTMFASLLFGLSDKRESSSCPWPGFLEGQCELPVGLAPGQQSCSPPSDFSRVQSWEHFTPTSAISPFSLFPIIYKLQAH